MQQSKNQSSIPGVLRNRLLAVIFTITAAGGAGVVAVSSHTTAVIIPSPAVQLAIEIGSYYEGTRYEPYQDTAGNWTVCRGITFNVQLNKTYTPSECRNLELQHYLYLEQHATLLYRHWQNYNVYVKASLLDMLFNLGVPQVKTSTHLKLANSGNLPAACEQMTRWVWAVDARSGQKIQLAGLVDRRSSTAELCAEWGRTGHFSEGLL